MKQLLLVMCIATGLGVAAEARQAQERPAKAVIQPAGGLQPGEVVRMFDAYVLMQAQERLDLDDTQFAKFIPKLRDLQETRRRLQVERQRMLGDLGRAVRSAPPAEEGTLRAQVQLLREQDARSNIELRKAYDAVDETLTAWQQARFRLFEEEMERRKFEMLSRARQPRRPRQH